MRYRNRGIYWTAGIVCLFKMPKNVATALLVRYFTTFFLQIIAKILQVSQVLSFELWSWSILLLFSKQRNRIALRIIVFCGSFIATATSVLLRYYRNRTASKKCDISWVVGSAFYFFWESVFLKRVSVQSSFHDRWRVTCAADPSVLPQAEENGGHRR